MGVIMFYQKLHGRNKDLMGHQFETFRLHSFVLQEQTLFCASCGQHKTKNTFFFKNPFF